MNQRSLITPQNHKLIARLRKKTPLYPNRIKPRKDKNKTSNSTFDKRTQPKQKRENENVTKG